MSALQHVNVELYPGAFYTPGPSCARFIASDERRLLLRAPNQVGKSLAGARRADRWSLANPGRVLGVLIADLDNHYAEVSRKIYDVVTLPEVHPDSSYVDGKGWYTNGRRGLKYRNGCRWLFRSGSGSTAGLEGFSADAGWVDEVPQRGHYGAFVRGVHGPLWVTLTPIGRDPAWFRRRVEGDPETGAPAEEAGWVQLVPSLSVEECPWRTAAQVQEMIDKTDPFERPQRIHAEWEGPTEGRRFSAFTGDHVLSEAPGGEYRVTVTMDHGEGVGRQHALLVLHNRRRVVVVDEYVNDTTTTPDADVRGILAMLHRHDLTPPMVDHWWGDVNSAGKLSAGRSVNDEIEAAFARAAGLRVSPISIRKPNKRAGSVEYGERLLNIAFAADELHIHERCRRLVRSLWHYTGPKDDDLKHPIDALRYGVQPILTDKRRPSAQRLYLSWGS